MHQKLLVHCKELFLMTECLYVNTKRLIYQACILSALCILYGYESWTFLRRHLKRLDSFHYRCIQSMNRQQWLACISSRQVRERWGDLETVSTKIQQRQLEWLGHLARMSDNPKIALLAG